jgi:hypothetical protein
MTPMECPREPEVLTAVLRRRLHAGPDDAQPSDDVNDLRVHIAHCGICADVAVIAALLHNDAESARHEVHVPAAGQVWWRAAVRARLDGAHAAERPLTWARGVAAASAAGLTIATIGIAWPTIDRAAAWVGNRALNAAPAAAAIVDFLSAAVQRSLPFALAAAAGMVLAPLALFLALSDD